MKAPLPHDETARLDALRQYDVLDTAPEQPFDDLTHLAAQMCQTPIAVISLVDEERLWFKSRVGMAAPEIPRAVSFCTQAIEQKDFLLVLDTFADARFAANELVNGDPPIRFYAGVPLVTPEGHAVGTLCVLDTVPRQLDETQQDVLHRLARQAVALLEARPDATTAKGQSRQARQRAERRRLTLAAETARRDADNLKTSETRYRRLFESAQEGILILDAQSGRIEDANPSLCELLGYAPDDFLGKQLWEIGTFRAIAASQDAFRALQEKDYIRYDDLALETRDGQIVSVEFVSNLYASGDKTVIQCNIRDISARKLAEVASSHLASIVKFSDDAIITKTLDGIITTWNAGAQALYGYSAEEVIGRSISLFVPPDMPDEMAHLLGKVGRGEPVEHYETVRVGKDGVRKDVSLSISPLKDGQGRIIGAATIKRDISERKQVENALRASEERFQSIVANVPGMVYQFVLQPDGSFEWPFVGEGCKEIYEVEPETIRRNPTLPGNMLHPDDRSGFESSALASAQTLLPWRWEGRLRMSSGKTRWIQVASRPQQLPGGAILWNGLLVDITARKEAEEERDRFFTLSLDMLAIVGSDGYFKRLNPAFEATLGFSNAELMAVPFLEFIHPDDRADTLEGMARLEGGSRVRLENRYRCRNGSYKWLRWMAAPYEDLWYCVAHDVTQIKGAEAALHKANDELELHVMERTAELGAVNESLQLEMAERRRAEESLYKNHEFLETILDNTAEGIVACDAEGQLTFFNRAIRDFHGLPLELLPADQWSHYYSLYLPDGVTPMPKEDVPLFRALRGDHVRDTEMVITPLEGRPRFLIANGEPLFDADGARLGAVVVMHDITEHKQAENALREAEERFRIAAHSASDLIYDLDLASNRLTWLGDIEGQLGHAAGTFPHTLEAWEGVIHPDDHERVMTAVERFLQGGESFSEEYRVVRRDGTFLYWTDRGMMLRDERGTPYRWIGATSNITERKQAEVELQRAKKEADAANLAKSEFLSRMSHELRTPLNSILGFGQILQEEAGTALQKESVGYILKGGRHLLDLINEVLDIARVESGHLEISPEPIALADVVPETCALLRPLAAQRNIRLDENTSELGHTYILADRQRLRQVLFNLLSNAIKYNREGGEVEVFCGQKPDGRTSIAVRDTGQGIAPHDLTKLFTPFERLGASNSNIEGTGLGLVLSQRLVTEMGGTLKVESALGQGTTFTFELPQATAPEKQLANLPHYTHSADTKREAEATYCVLCIEDNPANLRLLEVLFQDRPEFTLMAALQGSVGLDLARQHEPDLILLDLNLPDIHGKEVLARLQQSALTRDIPVVVVSADATPNQVERLLTAGARAYLSKPIDVKNFFHTLNMFLPMPPTTAPQPHNDEKVVN